MGNYDKKITRTTKYGKIQYHTVPPLEDAVVFTFPFRHFLSPMFGAWKVYEEMEKVAGPKGIHNACFELYDPARTGLITYVMPKEEIFPEGFRGSKGGGASPESADKEGVKGGEVPQPNKGEKSGDESADKEGVKGGEVPQPS